MTDETSGFRVPASADAWVHPWRDDRSDYETEFRETTLSEMSGEYGFPTLFNVRDSNWVLFTEADVDGRYCGSRVSLAENDFMLKVTFPPDETVETERPLATPWRFAIVGDLDTGVESNQVLDVRPSLQLSDTSWIDSGKAAWSWINGPSPGSFEGQKRFVDYVQENDWEAVLVDNGWEEDWMPDLADYADERDVAVCL